MNVCPLVRMITVSGVVSMCSIRSELRTSGTWLMRVSRTIRFPYSPDRQMQRGMDGISKECSGDIAKRLPAPPGGLLQNVENGPELFLEVFESADRFLKELSLGENS